MVSLSDKAGDSIQPRKRPNYEIAAEQFAILSNSLGLDMQAAFVPLSQSRNATSKQQSLNWRCTIARNGKPIAGLTAIDYMQGYAHCPAWRGASSVNRDAAMRLECETGKVAQISTIGGKPFATSRNILAPSVNDVLSALCLDASAIDCSGFEEWADELGYDTDSRSAQAIYHTCLATALALRAAIGDKPLQQLRDYAGQM